jgi:hypothetical protein
MKVVILWWKLGVQMQSFGGARCMHGEATYIELD